MNNTLTVRQTQTKTKSPVQKSLKSKLKLTGRKKFMKEMEREKRKEANIMIAIERIQKENNYSSIPKTMVSKEFKAYFTNKEQLYIQYVYYIRTKNTSKEAKKQCQGIIQAIQRLLNSMYGINKAKRTDQIIKEIIF